MSRPSSRASRSSRHSAAANISSNRDRAYRDHTSEEEPVRPTPLRADTRDLNTDSQGSDDDAEGRALASPPLAARRASLDAAALKASRPLETETESESETDTEDEKALDLEKGRPKKERRVWNMRSIASGGAPSPFDPLTQGGVGPQPSRKPSRRQQEGYAPVGADLGAESSEGEVPVARKPSRRSSKKRSSSAAAVAPAPAKEQGCMTTKMWWILGGLFVAIAIVIIIAVVMYMNHKNKVETTDSVSANSTMNGTLSSNSTSNSTSHSASASHSGSNSSSVAISGIESSTSKPANAASTDAYALHSSSETPVKSSDGGWQSAKIENDPSKAGAASSSPSASSGSISAPGSSGAGQMTTEDSFALHGETGGSHPTQQIQLDGNGQTAAPASTSPPAQTGALATTLITILPSTIPGEKPQGAIYSQASKPSLTNQGQQPTAAPSSPPPIALPSPLASPSQNLQGPITDDFPDYDGSQTSDKYEGRATWFESSGHSSTCETVFTDSDMVAALQPELYGASSSVSVFCGQKIHVWSPASNQTISVVIEDNCPLCQGELALDLSKAAFEKLGLLDDGVLQVQWWWDDPSMPALMPPNLGKNVAPIATLPLGQPIAQPTPAAGAWSPQSDQTQAQQPRTTTENGIMSRRFATILGVSPRALPSLLPRVSR